MADPKVTVKVLRRLLASGVTGRVDRLLTRLHPADLAPVLGSLEPAEIRVVVDLLFAHRRAASTLNELPTELLPQVIDALTDERLASVLCRLEVDDLVELIAAVPEERRARVIALLPEGKRSDLDRAERYPASSAGRVMTTRFVALEETLNAQQAIERLRRAGEDTEMVMYLYVVDAEKKLRGVIPIRRLVTAPPDRLCRDIMIENPASVSVHVDQEEAAQLVTRYNLLALPVTEDDGRLVGIITVDDVIEVIHEEATEDIYRLAGLSEEDRVFSPARQSVRKRLPWMLINLATAFLAAWVVGLFEHSISQIVALAVFLPVVAGMGGNGGTQALTIITRGIALGEIEFSTGLRAIGKEVLVGVVIGAVVGLVSALIAYLWRGNPYLGLVLLLAMIINMGVAGLSGAAVPLLLKAAKQDPALGSGVVVTTFTDVFGFLSFLGIATLMINHLR